MIATATPAAIEPGNIPAELKQLVRWVVWRRHPTKGKEPLQSSFPNINAKSNDPSTWSTYEAALATYKAGEVDGIGIVLGDLDDGRTLTGVDLDDCIVDGVMADEAQRVIDDLDTYCEVSPSGNGVKMIVFGKKPGPRCKTSKVDGYKRIEIYTKQFFTVTGRVLNDGAVQERHDEIATLYHEVFPSKDDTTPRPASGTAGEGFTGDDFALLGKARNAKNGPRFIDLYDIGNTTAYADDLSSADLALCNMLAFYTGPGSASRIDKLFRESQLYREKWEREDYRNMTIAKALDRTEFYKPREQTTKPSTTTEPKPRGTLRNVRLEPVLDDDGNPIKDDDGKDKLKAVALTPIEVRDQLVDRAGEVYTLGDGGPLFVPTLNPDGSPVRILKDPPDLFAHVKQHAEVRWSGKASEGGEVLSKAELHSTLKAMPSAVYDAVATLPHHPPMRRTYYATPDLPPPTGKALEQLVDRLNPETEQDRHLLLAAILTPAWGGPCGSRPMIVMTSDHGRGAGKTKTAEAIGKIYDGITTVSLETRDGIDRLRQRLLAPDSIAIRVVCIDNVKSSASSGEIESLITADTIDGHRLHHGNARRPNNLTWMLTANGIGLSRDLADRAVVIKLGKPKSGDFVTWAGQFIEENRLQIVADIVDRLKTSPLGDITPGNRDRWGAWQDAILRRVPDPDGLARLIIDRRGGLDQDAEDWHEVQHEVEALVEAIGGDALRPVAVPSNVLCDRLEHVTGQRFTGRGLATMLARFNGVGEAHRLVKNPSRARGRTYLWMPGDGTLDGTLGEQVDYPEWRGFNVAAMRKV